jgi:hypothetical protein
MSAKDLGAASHYSLIGRSLSYVMKVTCINIILHVWQSAIGIDPIAPLVFYIADVASRMEL